MRFGANTPLLGCVAAAVVMALLYATLLLDGDAVDFLIREGGLFESLTAIVLLIGGVLFALAFWRALGNPEVGGIERLVLLLLALLLIFSAGEEISWGQKVFNFSVPEGIREANAQDELNVHNLEFLSGALDPDFMFKAFWACFGVLIPVGCAVSRRLREALDRYVPILPLWLAALFVVNQLLAELATLSLRGSDLFEGSYGVEHSRQEILELGVAALLAVGAYVVWREVPRSASPTVQRATSSHEQPAGGAPRVKVADLMSATPVPVAGQAEPLLTATRLGIAGALSAALVGVALARDVEAGLGLLVALLFLPLVLLNLPLALTLWVPLVFLESLPQARFLPAGLMLIAIAWIGAVGLRSGLLTEVARRHRGLLILLGLFLAWITTSIVWATDTAATVGLLEGWYMAIALFVIFATTLSTERHLIGVCLGLIVGALLSAALAAPTLSLEAGAATSSEAGELGGALADPNYLAQGLLVGAVLAAGLMSMTDRSSYRWALGGAMIAFAVGLVATGSRGALIAAAVAIAASLLLMRGRRVQLGTLIVTGIAVAGLWLVTVAPSTLERLTTVDTTGTGRTDLWRIAIDMAEDQPILGVGLNNFRERSPEYILEPGQLLDAHLVVETPHVTHSIYLQALAETGVVGLALLVLLLFALLRATWIACRRFDAIGHRSLAGLSRIVLVAQIAAITAGSFLSNASDDRIWILFALGPVLQTIAARTGREP